MALGALVTSCRRGSPVTASGTESSDLRSCVRRQVQREGFKIEMPFPNVLSGTTGPVGPASWRDSNAMQDGTQVDQLTVWFGSELQVQGETRVRDRNATDNGWRRVPNSQRLNRAIDYLNKLCLTPVVGDTATGSR